MASKTKFLAALIVVVAVLVLFVLPAFDVDPTAMRSAREAAMLMLSIAVAASTFLAFKLRPAARLEAADARANVRCDLLQVTCTLLC